MTNKLIDTTYRQPERLPAAEYYNLFNHETAPGYRVLQELATRFLDQRYLDPNASNFREWLIFRDGQRSVLQFIYDRMRAVDSEKNNK